MNPEDYTSAVVQVSQLNGEPSSLQGEAEPNSVIVEAVKGVIPEQSIVRGSIAIRDGLLVPSTTTLTDDKGKAVVDADGDPEVTWAKGYLADGTEYQLYEPKQGFHEVQIMAQERFLSDEEGKDDDRAQKFRFKVIVTVDPSEFGKREIREFKDAFQAIAEEYSSPAQMPSEKSTAVRKRPGVQSNGSASGSQEAEVSEEKGADALGDSQ